ncbi:hypothetical protein Goshw_005556, partial [Gossypium schwendimanii]|nr:hypothetical protein [Gossypium schwendimanii]
MSSMSVLQSLSTCSMSQGTRRLQLFPQWMLQWIRMSFPPFLLDISSMYAPMD